MNNELYHHGVSGMKWGKRNGPPYPLNSAGKASLRKQRMDSYGKSVTKGGEPSSPKKLSQKHKEDYKMHKTYNRQRAKRAVRRDVALAMVGGGAIGTAVGGPMSGLASMLASGLATTAFSSAVNAGRNAVSNSEYKKMLLESQEFENAKDKGKEILNSSEKSQGWNEKTVKEYNDTRNAFNDDQRKDVWVDAFERANNPNLTDSQRAYAKAEAARIVDVDKRNKNYKSPNNHEYELLFLEAIQNKEILAFNDLKAIDAEYEKYKKDRDHYFEVEREKLRDY